MSNTTEMKGCNEMIGHAIGFAEAGKGQFLKTFGAIADDKYGWSPAEGAKTPIQLAAHIAVSNYGFAMMFSGEELPPMEEMFAKMAEEEAKLDTIDKVTAAIDDSHAKLVGVLQNMTEEQYNAPAPPVFEGMKNGDLIFYVGTHYYSHAAQVDYIQTCYGDHEFHM